MTTTIKINTRRLALFACAFTTNIPPVTGNCEKVIFRAPPAQPPSLPEPLDLALPHVHVLTPSERPSVRTLADSAFPTAELPHGRSSWFLLDQLAEGALYDVRLCWSSAQPTIFALGLFDLPTLLQEPHLLASLLDYSASRAGRGHDLVKTSPFVGGNGHQSEARSLLVLRVLAETEYHTSNATLMTSVPPVHADIILDVYHFGALPCSLVPLASYVALVVLVSWLVSRRIVAWIHAFSLATNGTESRKKARKQQ